MNNLLKQAVVVQEEGVDVGVSLKSKSQMNIKARENENGQNLFSFQV